MVEVDRLGKNYGTVEAVKAVSFSIDAGEIVGLLGPNGAGKTTIMKILTCFMFPSSGTARVNGYDIFSEPMGIKSSIGYLPENAPLYTDLNVMEYLEFIAESRSLKGPDKDMQIDRVVTTCGMEDLVYRGIDTLSKGYRQRVGLAQAIIHDPDILILDEPTTGLDPNQIVEIRDLIRHLGKEKTVILSTHILQEVEATCRRVMILNEGMIVAQGTTEEIWREMKGEDLLNLNLKAAEQPAEALNRSLGDVPGVEQVLNLQKNDSGTYSVQLALQAGSGAEEAVFDWVVGQGHKLLSMVPQRMSLEDIFIKLTREDE